MQKASLTMFGKDQNAEVSFFHASFAGDVKESSRNPRFQY